MACPVDRGSGPWTWRRGPGRVGGAERSAGERERQGGHLFFRGGAACLCVRVCVCVCSGRMCASFGSFVCRRAHVRVRALLIVVSLSRRVGVVCVSALYGGIAAAAWRRGGVGLGGYVHAGWCGACMYGLVCGNACICVRICICMCMYDMLCMYIYV